MQRHPVKTLAACLFGAALLAACGSPSKSTQTTAMTGGMQKGKVVAVESVGAAGTGMTSPGVTSSGASAAGSTMAGAPSAIITVQLADGTQSRYSVTQNKKTFRPGDTVTVIPDGENRVITSP